VVRRRARAPARPDDDPPRRVNDLAAAGCGG
jgi:hypothetical protein